MKRIAASLIVAACLMAYPIYSAMSMMSRNHIENADTTEGNELLSAFEEKTIDEAQKKIDETRQKRAEAVQEANLKAKIEESISEIESGKKSYRQVLKDVYIAGDSLMRGLEAYDILNYNHMITEVNANFGHLNEKFNTIVRLRPPVLILHYGLNMVSSKDERAESFATEYAYIIQRLKAALPNTRIIVSLIFPVNASIATDVRFTGIEEYNMCLIEMCVKENIEYLDSSSVLDAHSECYGDDGIHLSREFYSKYWLKHIMREAEIY